jgi:hypothetical protein
VSYEGSRLSTPRLPATVPLTNADNIFPNKVQLPTATFNAVSTNLFTYSDGTLATYGAFENVSDSPGSIFGFTNAIAFGDNSVVWRFAYKTNYILIPGAVYTFSFYVQMDDGRAPVPGISTNVNADFSITSQGLFGSTNTNCVVRQVYGSVYRVSVTLTAVTPSDFPFRIGIAKYSTNSARTFKATGYQLELRSEPSDYIKTEAAPVSRNELEVNGVLKSAGELVIATPESTAATLTRASAATIHGADYAVNAPRYLDNGVLIEEGTTNLFTNTDGAVGTYSGYQITDAPGTIAGFTNAIAFGNNSVQRAASRINYTTIIGTTYTLSAYVQMDDGGAPVAGGNSDATADFSMVLHNSVISTLSNCVITRVSGSLYRVSVTYTATLAGSNNGIYKYTTQSARSFKVTGYQLEIKSYATSYAESGATAFVRSPDVLRVPSTAWKKSSWGFAMTIFRTAPVIDGFYERIMNLRIEQFTNEYELRLSPNGSIDPVIYAGGYNVYYTTTFATRIEANRFYRISMTGNGTTLKIAVNGVIAGSLNYVEPSGTLPSFITIGGVVATECNGIYSNVQVFSRALTDAELIEASEGLHVPADAEWSLNNQLIATSKTLTLAADPTSAMHAVTKQYVDSKLAPTFVTNETPTGTINGTNTVFTLANTPTTGSVELYQNSLLLLPSVHFTVSGSTITYVSGFQPTTGETHRVSYRY